MSCAWIFVVLEATVSEDTLELVDRSREYVVANEEDYAKSFGYETRFG